MTPTPLPRVAGSADLENDLAGGVPRLDERERRSCLIEREDARYEWIQLAGDDEGDNGLEDLGVARTSDRSAAERRCRLRVRCGDDLGGVDRERSDLSQRVAADEVVDRRHTIGRGRAHLLDDVRAIGDVGRTEGLDEKPLPGARGADDPDAFSTSDLAAATPTPPPIPVMRSVSSGASFSWCTPSYTVAAATGRVDASTNETDGGLWATAAVDSSAYSP